MSLPIFRSFMPTVVKWANSAWRKEYKVITDDRTGAPIGLVSPNANGPEGIWAPTPLSSDQIANPAPAILADLNATFQLNEAPYSRYRSDGGQLVPLDSASGTVIPPGFNELVFSPLTVFEDSPLVVQGGLRVVE